MEKHFPRSDSSARPRTYSDSSNRCRGVATHSPGVHVIDPAEILVYMSTWDGKPSILGQTIARLLAHISSPKPNSWVVGFWLAKLLPIVISRVCVSPVYQARRHPRPNHWCDRDPAIMTLRKCHMSACSLSQTGLLLFSARKSGGRIHTDPVNRRRPQGLW